MKSSAVDKFISFWKDFDAVTGPYIHPLDRDSLLSVKNAKFVFDAPTTPPGWVDAVYEDNDAPVQLGLLPIPFVGDLRKADIFLCLLNPGLAPADFYAEERHPEYRDQLVKALRQDSYGGDEYPFWPLNPRFCWTGAATWWTGKLRRVIVAAAERWSCGYAEAAHRVSHRISVIELFPYHSRDFRLGKAIAKLASSPRGQGIHQRHGDRSNKDCDRHSTNERMGSGKRWKSASRL
ncbi:hypothetical protein NOJ05_18125 [Neorhizobium galegae]|uniref:hypothetical protein n=1 Tax=Neorhizobium galegae TaxID=399 RepID=UPI0021041E7A|nr:hypothetical protein [Neorhizobium galegae]MCQ1779125.1 hypothetical protein [Neorhizobium galegae]MCQ1799200.1 hypothetical protein [Neorhizobium galegae]